MHRIIRPSLVTLIAVLGLAGCGSPADHRLAQRGDTAQTVRRDMGKPDKQVNVAGSTGDQSVWTYNDYYRKVARRESTGWSEVILPGDTDQHGTVTQRPLTREIYRTEAAEDVQVTFNGGVVTDVAHLKFEPIPPDQATPAR